MKTQILEKLCTIFMIVAICTMMFSAQISLSTDIEKSVNHCISNQCIKVSGKPDPTTCAGDCKTFCSKQLTTPAEFIVPKSNGVTDTIASYICKKFNTCS
ncbi:hypothetical protein N665_0019s0035 [Sinapis alba]|nr:hypothetical protein N665_0019s0035 [Sinapis alba]